MWTGRWPEPVLAVAAATMFVVAGAAHLIGYRHPAGIPAADPSTASNARKAVPKQAPPGCLTTQQVLDQAAQRHGLEPSLVEAVAWWESGWDQKAVSDAGAVGLMLHHLDHVLADLRLEEPAGKGVDLKSVFAIDGKRVS